MRKIKLLQIDLSNVSSGVWVRSDQYLPPDNVNILCMGSDQSSWFNSYSSVTGWEQHNLRTVFAWKVQPFPLDIFWD